MLQLLTYFIIYGFFGWVMESTLFTVRSGHFVNRGFLRGPFEPIYGFGVLIILTLLDPFKDNIYLLFIFSGVFCTILEFFSGYFLELLFHTRWWDYSQKPYNFMGLICLENSIEWSILGVVMVRIMQPEVNKFLSLFTPQQISYFSFAAIVLIIVDFAFTIKSMLILNGNNKLVHKLHNVLTKANVKSREEYEQLLAKLENGQIDFYEFISKAYNEIEDEGIKAILNKIYVLTKTKTGTILRWQRNYKDFDLVGHRKIRKFLSTLRKKDEQN